MRDIFRILAASNPSIISFEASETHPEEGENVTLSWNVQCSTCERYYTIDGGDRSGPLPASGSVSVSSDSSTTRTYRLHADTFCKDVTSDPLQITWHEPEPEIPLGARSKIIIRNQQSTTQHIYVNDTSDESPLESWEEIFNLNPYEENDVEFEEGHFYSFRSVDPTMTNCPGNDPSNTNCRRSWAGIFPGHPSGSVVTWTI